MVGLLDDVGQAFKDIGETVADAAKGLVDSVTSVLGGGETPAPAEAAGQKSEKTTLQNLDLTGLTKGLEGINFQDATPDSKSPDAGVSSPGKEEGLGL